MVIIIFLNMPTVGVGQRGKELGDVTTINEFWSNLSKSNQWKNLTNKYEKILV